MTRRKFNREFKTEAVRPVIDRGVAVSQAARELDLSESVLRRWMRELSAAPAAAFPGNGQMRADLAEITALKKEVVRFRAERDILKKGETIFRHWFKDNRRTLFSRARRHEICLYCQAPAHLASQLALRGAVGFLLRLPRLAQPPDQHPRDP